MISNFPLIHDKLSTIPTPSLALKHSHLTGPVTSSPLILPPTLNQLGMIICSPSPSLDQLSLFNHPPSPDKSIQCESPLKCDFFSTKLPSKSCVFTLKSSPSPLKMSPDMLKPGIDTIPSPIEDWYKSDDDDTCPHTQSSPTPMTLEESPTPATTWYETEVSVHSCTDEYVEPGLQNDVVKRMLMLCSDRNLVKLNVTQHN